MGVLTYSAISKAGKIISDKFSDADSTKIVSLKIPIEFDEIYLGNTFEMDLGELPAGSVLLQSQIAVDTIFRESINYTSPWISVGVKNSEYDETDFPVDYYKKLIFRDLSLSLEYGTYGGQGYLVRSDYYSSDESRTISKQINKYNNNLVLYIESRGAWSAGGDLNTQRGYLSACGSQTAGLAFGGYYTARLSSSEEYNGSSWSAGGALNTAVYTAAGCGSQIAGLSFGGNSTSSSYTNVTEEYDGSSWTTGGNLNVSKRYISGFGAQDAAVCTGGNDSVPDYLNATEEYDGAAWTTSNDLNSARVHAGASGTLSDGLCFGGYDAIGYFDSTELYNGTTWSLGNPISMARSHISGCGDSNGSLAFNGTTGNSDTLQITEEYDGFGWSVTNNLITGRFSSGGCGSSNSALCMGGYDLSAYMASTEEYNPVSLLDLDQGSATIFITYSYQ